MESQPAKSSPALRLLPLVADSPNEGLANALARLLIEDETQAEMGSKGALLILSGIQTFIDSGGDYLAVERVWEPVIVARYLEKAYKLDAPKQARQLAGALRKGGDMRGSWIYDHAADLLDPDINKPVDSSH
jgi:hypothetical protein